MNMALREGQQLWDVLSMLLQEEVCIVQGWKICNHDTYNNIYIDDDDNNNDNNNNSYNIITMIVIFIQRIGVHVRV